MRPKCGKLMKCILKGNSKVMSMPVGKEKDYLGKREKENYLKIKKTTKGTPRKKKLCRFMIREEGNCKRRKQINWNETDSFT